MNQITNEAVKTLILSNYPRVLVLVSASWCQPCHRFRPVFLKVSEDLSARGVNCAIEDADDDLTPNLSSVPTVCFYKNGELVKMFTSPLTEIDEIISMATESTESHSESKPRIE
jgi:thioredoxin-like negative regulator of GroEL